MVKKIAITGPESTGKSELSEKLAAHYHTVYVPEFARKYIDELEREYTREDILVIAQNQIQQEKEVAWHANEYLICDTELIVTKIWSMHLYKDCHPWILEKIHSNRYDLFLLCDIDLPWQYDKQREHPHKRQFFFEWYRNELEQYRFPYKVISGSGEKRVQNAIDAIDGFFRK